MDPSVNLTWTCVVAVALPMYRCVAGPPARSAFAAVTATALDGMLFPILLPPLAMRYAQVGPMATIAQSVPSNCASKKFSFDATSTPIVPAPVPPLMIV